MLRPVGPSIEPAKIEVNVAPNSRQKRMLPQVLQKPRSAVSDDLYHVIVAPTMFRSSDLHFVAAT
jgi:hypothetical protein